MRPAIACQTNYFGTDATDASSVGFARVDSLVSHDRKRNYYCRL